MCVCLCHSVSLCLLVCLSACLLSLSKNDQAGGPETHILNLCGLTQTPMTLYTYTYKLM